LTLDVTQEEAEKTTRRLALEEGIFSGVSSGGACAAACRLAGTLDSGVVVFILCDQGDRYLSSDLFSTSVEAGSRKGSD
jgi:cysteine synthase B